MVKSFWRMHTDPPGFDPNGIVTIKLSLATQESNTSQFARSAK